MGVTLVVYGAMKSHETMLMSQVVYEVELRVEKLMSAVAVVEECYMVSKVVEYQMDLKDWRARKGLLLFFSDFC